MTCEALCMNSLGLAIAVDSAVSLAHNGKAYHNAEKLFPLGNGAPVAVATFGAATFAGVPWKLVIESWDRARGDRRFERLEEYAQDLLAYLEQPLPMFSAEHDRKSLGARIVAYWRPIFGPVFEQWGQDTRDWGPEAWDLLRANLADDAKYWTYGLMEGFDESFGDTVIAEHADVLDEVREQWFDGAEPPHDVWAELIAIVQKMHTQAWVSPADSSGIVLLGYGESDFFPGYVEHRIGPRVAGRVRWIESGRSQTGIEDGLVRPFAQSDMIDAFMLGIPTRMLPRVEQLVHRGMHRTLENADVPDAAAAGVDVDSAANETTMEIHEMLREEYLSPLLRAVSSVPVRELSNLARTLVSLAAFRSQFSADETGTVGGEIRVAEITKYGGFVWR